MKPAITIDVACERVNITGEVPLWSTRDETLYWVDNRGDAILGLDRDGKTSIWATPRRVNGVGVRAAGGLIATMIDGVYEAELDGRGVDGVDGVCHTRLLARPPLDPGVRLKDGRVDPLGRYWFGTTGDDRVTPLGRLIRLDATGRLAEIADGFIILNALAFSPDRRRMTVADSIRDIVYVYDFDPGDGGVSNRRPYVSTRWLPGVVDGATFDEEGFFWCALIHDGAVARYDPDGHLDRLIRLPVEHPTMCVFGGPALDTLYVTTASGFPSRTGRPPHPDAGKLFAVRGLGVRGFPEPEFGRP